MRPTNFPVITCRSYFCHPGFSPSAFHS